ncbi:hypothetical protein TSAR_012774 [Trichomalopsis sarcophagae]|uniref:Uncharacterized protein n=1 Tax=Trichomalopsis sarcophagae TaxID=543379 RepID=A0A232FIY5_9HYME|nr:hypothetical protein TSAR_012774 [Trichomalopsis sarcophagae]
MNAAAKDLSILSYKELQALAVKHRVPGNIKKQYLLEILHAINKRDSTEVSRLLSDLKKNRKKRTKRLKMMKTEDDRSLQMNLQNNSPNLPLLQDHYLFPGQQQQQYQFQWLNAPQIGAEEEIGTSKFDDSRCALSYNDFQQLVLYTSQNVYGNCDTNNNSTLLDEIMDLRTEATVSNYRSNLDVTHYSNSGQQSIIQQPANDNASKKMSLLLKKMLQAPAGANLGEIASPVSTWNLDTYHVREQSPDNSETMTAKSDINENDEMWQDCVTGTGLPYVFENEQSYTDNPYYRRNNNASYYRSPLDNVAEQSSLTYEQQASNQYQFNYAPQTDPQENCRSWLAATALDASDAIEYGANSRFMISDTTLQYQSSNNLEISNLSPEDSNNIVQQNNQYCLTDSLYGRTENNNLLESSEIAPDLNPNASPFYQHSTSLIKSRDPPDYYQQICGTTESSGFGQSFYEPQPNQQSNQQQPAGNQSQHCSDYSQQLVAPIYHVDLDSGAYGTPGHYQELQPQQQSSATSNHPTADPLQQVQAPPQPQPQQPSQQYDNYAPPAYMQTNPPPYGSGVLDSYWPRWSYKDQDVISQRIGGRVLENTLNICTPNYVDYEKLNETCSVYSNTAPVMTLRKGINSAISSQEMRNASASTNSEFRQHNFSSNCLLYNEDGAELIRRNLTPPISSADTGYFSLTQESDAEYIL